MKLFAFTLQQLIEQSRKIAATLPEKSNSKLRELYH
jgi:hypothetical protein